MEAKVDLGSIPNWELNSAQHLTRSFKFSDFMSALHFVNQIGELAERIQHHPEITLGWGHVELELWSHDKNSVTERDLQLAQQINHLKK